MSGLFHAASLRSYVKYIAASASREIMNLNSAEIVCNGSARSIFNYVFCDKNISQSELEEVLCILRGRRLEMSWPVEHSMALLKMRLEENLIFRTSNPKKAFLDLDQFKPGINDSPDVELQLVETLDSLSVFDSLSSDIFFHGKGLCSDAFKCLHNIDPNRLSLFLVRFRGRIAAMCAFYVDGEVATLYADGVDPYFRGFGIAKQMILKRIQIVCSLNCKYVIAHCINPKSESLYRRMGFRMLGALGLHYFSG